MDLLATTLCTYRTSLGNPPWRDLDYCAWQFVQALKNRAVMGYGWIPIRGSRRRLDDDNRDDAIPWAAEIAADQIAEMLDDVERVHLVPIPSKSALTVTDETRTARLAELIVAEMGTRATMSDCLRWNTQLEPAHLGGPRDAATLYSALRVATKPIAGAQIWLIDDVLTSGGHFRAAERILFDAGFEVERALAIGRADDAVVDSPFATRHEVIGEFRD